MAKKTHIDQYLPCKCGSEEKKDAAKQISHHKKNSQNKRCITRRTLSWLLALNKYNTDENQKKRLFLTNITWWIKLEVFVGVVTAGLYYRRYDSRRTAIMILFNPRAGNLGESGLIMHYNNPDKNINTSLRILDNMIGLDTHHEVTWCGTLLAVDQRELALIGDLLEIMCLPSQRRMLAYLTVMFAL